MSSATARPRQRRPACVFKSTPACVCVQVNDGMRVCSSQRRPARPKAHRPSPIKGRLTQRTKLAYDARTAPVEYLELPKEKPRELKRKQLNGHERTHDTVSHNIDILINVMNSSEIYHCEHVWLQQLRLKHARCKAAVQAVPVRSHRVQARRSRQPPAR